MRIYRGLLVILEMSLFAIGAFIIGWIIFPILGLRYKGSERRRKFALIIHNSWKFFISVMEKSKMIKVNITGGSLVDIKGRVVVASHPSLIDIILLIGNMPNSLCLVKNGILKNPFMSNIVKSLYIINDIDPEVFQKSCLEALNEGYNIIIFPTGTRTLPGEDVKVHKGAAQIAIASGVDIVPIKIQTDSPFLMKNHCPLHAGDKTVNYTLTVLPEIKLSDFPKELTDIKLRNHITEKIKEAIN